MGVFYPQIILSKFQAYEKIIVPQFIMVYAILFIAVILFLSIYKYYFYSNYSSIIPVVIDCG